jgi:sugar phosphate isomerase/epimerase
MQWLPHDVPSAADRTDGLEQELEIVCPAWCPGAQSLVDAITMLANQGATAVELSTNYPRFGIQCPDYFDHRNAFEIEILMAELRASGIRVNSVHSPFGTHCDISSQMDDVHERGVDTLIESIELASVVGAKFVVVHASDKLTDGVAKRMDRARGVLREISVVAEESGVVLALENLPPGYLGHTPEEIELLMDGTKDGVVGVCFDCGHANLSGLFTEYAELLLPYAVTIHAHDNDGARDQHKFPGGGNVLWRSFAEIYHRVADSPSVMLECAPPDGSTWGAAFQKFTKTLGV